MIIKFYAHELSLFTAIKKDRFILVIFKYLLAGLFLTQLACSQKYNTMYFIFGKNMQ